MAKRQAAEGGDISRASRIVRGVYDTLGELYVRGGHGAAELAAALYTGNAYVAYGHVRPNQTQQETDHMQAQDQETQAKQETQSEQQAEAPAQKPEAAEQAVKGLEERQPYVKPPQQDQAQQQRQQGPRQ